jgi:murein DD-endopeptidase MepM/ murein hydrolase activator NlpD
MALFPLRQRPKLDYKTPPRSFGCARDKGRRKHAGCDLYASIGTEVLAVEDGEIIQPVYFFYLGTYALEVKHASGIVVRYGEIQKNTPKLWKAGDKVTAGEVLGFVGQLQGLPVAMLHFELFAGTATGQLTVRTEGGFQRRSDLMDPTAFLDECVVI